MKANPQLQKFIEPYNEEVKHLTIWLRDVVTTLVPETNELIWDNYNAVAIAYSKSDKLKDAFCHIALYSNHLNFGFNRGAELTNSNIKLEGKGKLIRHLKVSSTEDFPIDEIKKMILESVMVSEKLNPDLLNSNNHPKSIVMSVSEKKIRPKK